MDVDQVNEIEAGADIYGESGLLDSIQLVSLIAAIEEGLTDAFGKPTDLFGQQNWALLAAFTNTTSLVSFLERRWVDGDKNT